MASDQVDVLLPAGEVDVNGDGGGSSFAASSTPIRESIIRLSWHDGSKKPRMLRGASTRGQSARRGGEAMSTNLAAGDLVLPRVRDVDPSRLLMHGSPDGALEPYMPREVDKELDKALASPG